MTAHDFGGPGGACRNCGLSFATMEASKPAADFCPGHAPVSLTPFQRKAAPYYEQQLGVFLKLAKEDLPDGHLDQMLLRLGLRRR